ncbi:outer membrane protein [Candidatus Bandiella euplotis]|uniref:Outer membrane porin family protein n=1 Tax=Candidatus Bandiella euplotis TaxID=1664265 RepID=A0ABZ0UIX6_9RICK|nr:hypothetical protein [Candidatus Bandiella woodruffii]WPX96023.1 Putative outer membrane porin family protein [Candidatus Bandiella woodruffii]
MKKLLLTTTIIAGVALSASATEAGKMYVRGDAGYQFSGSKVDALKSVGATNGGGKLKGFTGDIGFGYAIADNIRTDLTVSFSSPSAKQTNKLATNPAGTDEKFVAFVDGAALTKAQTASDAANLAPGITRKTVGAVSNNTVIITAASAANSGSIGTVTQATVDAAAQTLAVAKAGKGFNLTKDHTAKTKNKTIGLIANVYYDIATGSAFTPYVMGGIGLDRSKQEFTFSGKNGLTVTGGTNVAVQDDSLTLKSKNKNSFAYQVGLGVGVEVSKDVVLDVGYKLSGRSKDKHVYKIAQGGSFAYGKSSDVYNNTKDFETKSPSVQYSFTAGVRFAF